MDLEGRAEEFIVLEGYDLLELLRLSRCLRAVRANDKLSEWIFVRLDISLMSQHLIWLLMLLLIFTHVSSCLWFVLEKNQKTSRNWIFSNNLQDSSTFDVSRNTHFSNTRLACTSWRNP